MIIPQNKKQLNNLIILIFLGTFDDLGTNIMQNAKWTAQGSPFEAGGALRLKLSRVQIPSGPYTVLRTTLTFESPRAKGCNGASH
jgi:hypothetical protein